MKHTIVITFFILIPTALSAQSAADHFHTGANYFIDSQLDQAIAEVQTGLSRYPDDPKLQTLLEKLKEQKEQQQQQQQQEQNQDQQEQQDQEQQDQQQENEENKDQEQNEQPQDPQEEQDSSESDQQQPQPENMREISKEEADKILKALAQKEKELLKQFKKQKKTGSAKHDKDW